MHKKHVSLVIADEWSCREERQSEFYVIDESRAIYFWHILMLLGKIVFKHWLDYLVFNYLGEKRSAANVNQIQELNGKQSR